MNIKELGLSTRAYHIMKRNFIDTVEQLVGKSREDLMNIPGVGFGTATEIIARVRAVKMTNADNIRSMTDKELADFLYRVMHSTRKAARGEQVLEWLQTSVEG